MVRVKEQYGGSPLETQYGLPVVNANTIFQVFKELGIRPWRRVGYPMSFEEYAHHSSLTDEQKKELRFAPHVETVTFMDDRQKPFRGFRTSTKDSVTVFTLLPGDLVPVCGEFRHGYESVMVNLPGGMVGGETPDVCAMREFEEETGIALQYLESLALHGIPRDARATTGTNFYFLGTLRDPLVVREPKLDEEEVLRTVLIPLRDWRVLLTSGKVDGFSVITTLFAVERLNRF